VRACRFGADGRRVADRVVPEDVRAAEEVVLGAAARGDSLILATARGLVREDGAGAERTLPETAPFVSPSAQVALAPGGVLVADGCLVRHLVLH
jgi:hypothetical protein